MKGRRPKFVLSCVYCDAGDGVPTAMAALCTGWTGLQADDAPSWSFLGSCPECAREAEENYEKHVARERVRAAEKRRKYRAGIKRRLRSSAELREACKPLMGRRPLR